MYKCEVWALFNVLITFKYPTTLGKKNPFFPFYVDIKKQQKRSQNSNMDWFSLKILTKSIRTCQKKVLKTKQKPFFLSMKCPKNWTFYIKMIPRNPTKGQNKIFFSIFVPKKPLKNIFFDQKRFVRKKIKLVYLGKFE